MTAIDRAFSDERLEKTLTNSTYGVESWRLNLPALTDSLPGGSYKLGGTFDVNFDESFKKLSSEEQQEIEQYYCTKVSAIGNKWRDRFPRAFGQLK